jgi:hypothetical protein
MKDVSREVYVPILIAKEGVELAHGGIILLVAPSELPILEMYLFEVAQVKSVTELGHPSAIRIRSILVTRPVNLVEVARNNPLYARDRLFIKELLVEGGFQIIPRWPINIGYLEGRVGMHNCNQAGDEELSRCDICDVDNISIPQKEDTTSSAISRPLGIAF